MMRTPLSRAATLALSFALAACGGGGSSPPAPPPVAEQPPPGPNGDQGYNDASSYSTASNASLSFANEGVALTHHDITLPSGTLHYTARAGHMTVNDGNGQPAASFFYVAYTLDGSDAATRPVTFFYNGGPGSASVWLHLGSFSPKRLVTGDPATNAPTPFPLVDNQETLLPTTDMVFVDAVGTGYSEAIAPRRNQDFWGVDADAAVFRDFVQRYVSVYSRIASPKFLFGESYGTTRSAVLADLLETANVRLHGVVLQSSVLDYNANCGVIGSGGCSGYLPTYATTADYYGKVTPVPADFGAFVDQVRQLTDATYTPALIAWSSQGTPPSASLLATLSADTGVPVSLWQSDFNLDPGTFQSALIPGTLIGRYDARVSAPAGSALAAGGDPSSTFIDAQFRSAITNYLRNGLQYASVSGYTTLGNAINTWDFSHEGKPLPDTVPDLATALTLDPRLKVLSLNGYHDLATPFHQTERDLARLGANPNVQLRYYAGGHMTYLDDTSRPLELADVKAFYAAALNGSAR